MAIIGAGGVSRHHCNAIVQQPETATLVAVADRNLDSARTLVAAAPYEVDIVDDYRLLLDRQNTDAVIVAVPHHLHYPIGCDVVAAGLPVLIEKPLTCTLDETRALRDLAVISGVPVVAGQMRRFNREAVWLRRWITDSSENFGELRSFTIHSWQNLIAYLRGVLGLPAGSDHWLLDGDRAGGGVVISLACHQLDLLRFLTGNDISEVVAHGRFDKPFYNGAESSAVVLIRTENGAAGVLHANYLTPRTPHHEAMYLFGEHGMIAQHADQIGQYHGSFRFGSGRVEECSSWDDQYAGIREVPADEVTDLNENPFFNQLASFAVSLVNGTPPLNRIDQNFNTMASLQAINESIRSGRPEAVATS